MKAWRGWYHVTGNTYGTWLRGDPRGWRARWHREHVEGDYKDPPARGTFEGLYDRSKRSMKRSPIRLAVDQRRIGGQALVEKLLELEVELLDLSLNDVHYHLLARFPDKRIRWWVGLAKKHASWALSADGLKGTVWGRKCHPTPIGDREHQLNVFDYIKDHVKQGAWVWTFREGLYWLQQK